MVVLISGRPAQPRAKAEQRQGCQAKASPHDAACRALKRWPSADDCRVIGGRDSPRQAACWALAQHENLKPLDCARLPTERAVHRAQLLQRGAHVQTTRRLGWRRCTGMGSLQSFTLRPCRPSERIIGNVGQTALPLQLRRDGFRRRCQTPPRGPAPLHFSHVTAL